MTDVNTPVSSGPPEIELWNGRLGSKWAAQAESFDFMLAPLTEPLLRSADLANAARVLDVGCGAGAVAICAADRVGADGIVHGVDFSRQLIEVARRRADGIPNLSFFLADIDDFEAASPYDIALSRLGLMFFADAASSLAALRRRLVAGGRLAFACWQALEVNDWAALPLQVIGPGLDPRPSPPPPGVAGPFAFADRDRLESILSASGWKGVRIAPWRNELTLPGATIEDTALFLVQFGPLGRLVEKHELKPEAVAETLSRDLRGKGFVDGAVRLKAAAWMVEATA